MINMGEMRVGLGASGASSEQNLSASLWHRLREAPANSELWLALVAEYVERDLPWQADYAARNVIRLDAGLAASVFVLIKEAPSGIADGVLGGPSFSDADDMARRFYASVQKVPEDWLSWLFLARLMEMMSADALNGLPDQEGAVRHAQEWEPIPGETMHSIGVWRLSSGDAPGAVSALAGLVELRPIRYSSMMHLGEALLRVGNVQGAEKAFTRAALSPNPDFLKLLAARVYELNYWQEAIAILKNVVSAKPDDVPAWLSLARIQSEVYDLAGCRVSLERLKLIDPSNAEARLIEAGFVGRLGDAKAHFSILRQAYENGGDPLSRLASSVAMTLLYQSEMPPEEVAAWHRHLCAPIEAAMVRKMEFDNAKIPDRRLRIGYVTGDLHRQHPVNIFMLPVLIRHNHESFEIFVYHTGNMHDEYTRQAKKCADHWMEAGKLDDNGLQQAIVRDGVDVLIDLAGHTSSHRLGVFAMRAAPVQATFLGYPFSTGLSTMDWLIGDPVVTPAEHEHLYSEGLAQLPYSVFCWAPVDEYPLPPPRPLDAPLVFGSFNNAMKLSPKTISLWARIMKAVPEALLLLKAPSLRDDEVQARYQALFKAEGVDPKRLLLRGPTELGQMMQEYGDVDIGLDPVPYNGGTTTMQALWMGVPVITLAGDNFVGRMGASFMQSLGHPDWVADNDDAYVATAVRLAKQCKSLRAGRAKLRETMINSPVCDIQSYVGHFESLLREMWIAYCKDERCRLIQAHDQTSVASPEKCKKG